MAQPLGELRVAENLLLQSLDSNLAANGLATSATIQWRAKDGSTPWISVGDPIALNPMGYFTATRTAPQPALGEWRGALIDGPTGAVLATTPGTSGV